MVALSEKKRNDKQTKLSSRPLTVIDFFCGAGGFSEGFRMAGFDIIMGIDNWQPAITTHNINHGLNDSVKSVLDFEDIEEILNLPDSDIIIGSPPCVLFSLSNRGGNANKDLGVRSMRAFYRVVAVKKHQKGSTLKAWIMENVPNSRNYVQPTYTFKDLDLEEWALAEGLNSDDVAISVRDNGDVLSSNEYGSAQTRKRFVCGEITETGEFPYPERSKDADVTLETLFSDFPKPMGTKYNSAMTVRDPNYKTVSLDVHGLHDHFYDSGVYEIEWQKAKDAKQNHPYMGRMSFPENQSRPSRTIMATKSASTREAILYKSELNRTGDGEYRTPTIREAATIMGFPLTYEFYGNESTKWRQVGNAVCVQLSYALAKKVKELLEIELPVPAELKKDLAEIQFLDSPVARTFDKPPKRKSDALFRAHPLKTGNITVDLTNRGGVDKNDWQVIAHAGTGQGYTSVAITSQHSKEAEYILKEKTHDFVGRIKKDEYVKPYTKDELDSYNKEYGYVCSDERHPYKVIQRISKYIEESLDEDTLCSTRDSSLSNLKSTIPLSQVMSIYAMGLLVGNN